jgi:hypothetical protein
MKGNIMANSTTILRNATLNYAKVYKPEMNPFGKEVFDIQLEFTKDRIDEFSPYGKVRQLSNGNFAININRPAVNGKGQRNSIRVVDSEKNSIDAPIGNGSTGNVMVYTYDWNVGGRSGTKSVLIAVQVTDLVEYNPESSMDFDLVVSEGNTTAPAQDF